MDKEKYVRRAGKDEPHGIGPREVPCVSVPPVQGTSVLTHCREPKLRDDIVKRITLLPHAEQNGMSKWKDECKQNDESSPE